MFLSLQDKQRFCSKLSIGDSSQCWLWQSGRFDSGYGAFKVRRQNRLAHRISYQIFNKKDVPESLHIRHTCDNRQCCNPYHLLPGTHQDNMDDKTARGNTVKGEKNGFSKFTEEQIKNIRLEYSAGNVLQRRLAKKYNTSQTNISAIVRKEHWKHV